VTHALGTGGRDLSEAVGAATARQSLELLSRDPETAVIVLISKPPAPAVAGELLAAARAAGKPVVVDFIGHATALRRSDDVYLSGTFDEAAGLAVALAAGRGQPAGDAPSEEALAGAAGRFAARQRYLRGLFSGGTLAYEALLLLQGYLPAVYANAPLDKRYRLANAMVSQEHTIVDLGEDEFTVGRLHPMMDNDLRIRRLEQEAADPEVAVLLLDVVLGYGAHPDPAGELAPAIARARAAAALAGRHLEVVAVVVGTDEDPQDMAGQVERLREAGAHVYTSNEAAVRHAGRLARLLGAADGAAEGAPAGALVPLEVISAPLAGINVGLESFAESLRAQGAAALHVDWKPPAGGNERLMAILARMKGT
jgi:FdrA protein